MQTIRCIKGNPSYTACVTKGCEVRAHMCKQDCECHDPHSKCNDVDKWKKLHTQALYILINKQDELSKYQKRYEGLTGELLKKLSDQASRLVSVIECDVNNLNKFFFPKKISTISRVYRASENNYSVKEFHKKCDGIGPNLVLILTEFNHVIGAYTPLSWRSEGGFISNQRRQTFLFSLTHNQKIGIIANQSKEIYCDEAYGPTYGFNDLYICDRANRKGYSWCTVGCTFNNGKNKYKSQESFTKWSGQQKGFEFKILQWEVFTIDLQ